MGRAKGLTLWNILGGSACGCRVCRIVWLWLMVMCACAVGCEDDCRCDNTHGGHGTVFWRAAGGDEATVDGQRRTGVLRSLQRVPAQRLRQVVSTLLLVRRRVPIINAVWPDPRSRSRSSALQRWKSGRFQTLSPPPFTTGAGNWPRGWNFSKYAYGKTFKILLRLFHRETDRHVVFKCREIWPTGNWWNRALFTWQKKTKFRLALQLSLLRGSHPKSAPTMYSKSAPGGRFHPNPFTLGWFIAERVNSANTRRKVNSTTLRSSIEYRGVEMSSTLFELAVD